MTGVGGAPPPAVQEPDGDEEGRRLAREVTGRAIRRLGALTAAIMVAAVVLSFLAGGVVAFLLAGSGLPFRGTWAVTSILFLVVPAGAVWLRERRSR